jgi:two-component system, OmpR family, sensor kinase
VSLRVTLVAAFAYALLAVLIALELPLILNLSKRIDAEVRAESAGQVSLVATTAASDLEDRTRLRTLLERSAQALGGRVIVTDAEGRVIADSAGRGLEGADYGDRPEIQTALAGQNAQGERRSESLDEELLYTAAPVVRNGRTVGAVRATQSVAAVDEEVRNDALVLVAAGGVALLLGLAVAWVLASFLTRPLNSLAATARRVTGGDLDARAPVSGSREQRQVAASFNEMTSRLQSALEAQREFVANASHQLRTPLTGLRLRLEAAGDQARDPAVREELDAAEQEVERLSGLLANLLVLAREGQERLEPAVVDLGREARLAQERWDGEARSLGREVEVAGGDGVRVLAAPDDVGIVLDNLIENALKYAPAGDVTIGWRREGERGVLAVDDEGAGLEAGEHEHVLGRFTRGRASAGRAGTGLGLAIVAAIAERWGGEARLVDRTPHGLRAEVALPFADSLPGPR